MENYRLNEINKISSNTKLSRTLYVGNLNENINDATLYKYFGEFGDIMSINIKNGENVYGRPSKKYAFIKYFHSNNVIIAIHKMNGVNIEGCQLRLGFGNSYPSKCVWITSTTDLGDNNSFLLTCVAAFGAIQNIVIDRINKRALVHFHKFVDSEAAINKMKNGLINGLNLLGDYASIECQQKFAEFYHPQNNEKYLSIDLDNVDIQNTPISNVNKQKSAVSHYVEASIASKEITCIWVSNIADSVTNEYLESHFSQFGPIDKCLIDRFNKCALLCFQKKLHAQSAVTKMNGKYIKGKPVYVHLASLKCPASVVPNVNNDNGTIQLKDNTAQSSSYSARHVDPSCKSTINDETYPINISDPRNSSINANNAQCTIQLKDNTAQSSSYSARHVDPSCKSTINDETYPINISDPRNSSINANNAQCTIQLKDNTAQSSSYSARHVDPSCKSTINDETYPINISDPRNSSINANNAQCTIQLKDNTAQSSSYSARHVDPSCKSTINDETYPINISDPRNSSINANNAQCTSQHKYLNTYNINPKYSSKTHHIYNSPISITFNEYPPERLMPPTQYANSDILSLPLPEFAKNISKELTSTSSRYSLSSNAFGNQDTYTFNIHHDEMINYGLGKTDNQDKKQDQNNNHQPKSNYKMLESAADVQHLNFKEAKRGQDVLNKHTPKEFIQSQSSLKFKDQQLSSSLGTLSTSCSSKYSLGSSASVIQSKYNSPSDTQPKIIPQQSKTSLLDSQILPSGPKLLIDPKCSSATNGMISEINGLFLTKKNICTISNSMHTSDAKNTDFVNPIPKDVDRNKTVLEIGHKFRDKYPKDSVTPSNWLTNTPKYNCVEKLNHFQEKEGHKKLQSKRKSSDGFVAKNSIEPVFQPNFVDVEKSTSIDEGKIDNDICKKSIPNVLLSLKTNYQNKIIHNETKDKIKKTNCNELAGSISTNGNSEINKSVYYNHININEYKDNESQCISSTGIGCKSHNIKPNKIQGEVEKTNFNEEDICKHLNIKNNKERKKPILYFDHHEKKKKYCKSKTILDCNSIEPKFSKCDIFKFDMFKIKQTINKKKETKNKDCKLDKGPTTTEEEKQNLNILKSHNKTRKDYKYKKNEDNYQNSSCIKFDINNDNKSKKYIKKVDGNITSSYCSTENSLKRSVSNPSEYHNDSKRWKTDSKTYKNDSTKTSKYHSPLSKPSKNMSKLDKTPNQPKNRGWLNGHSILDILSNDPKLSISNKVKTRSTNNMKK